MGLVGLLRPSTALGSGCTHLCLHPGLKTCPVCLDCSGSAFCVFQTAPPSAMPRVLLLCLQAALNPSRKPWTDEVPCCAVGAGECLGSGAAGTVYAAEWDGAEIAIKLPSESDECSFDRALHLLQLEEEVYRYLHGHLERCPGALLVLGPCCGRASRVRLTATAAVRGLLLVQVRSKAGIAKILLNACAVIPKILRTGLIEYAAQSQHLASGSSTSSQS